MAVSFAATLGLLTACVLMLVQLRRDAWTQADQASANVLEVLSREIARDIELYDLSLQAVVEGLRHPGVMSAEPTLRDMILFDRAASARGLGSILVTDEHGAIILRSRPGAVETMSVGDREYFSIHRERDVGCFIGPPIVSRASMEPVVTLSRRISRPDGSFGGVAVGGIKIRYLQDLLDRVALGRGTVTLIKDSGTVVARSPVSEKGLGRTFSAIDRMRGAAGSFVATSPVDDVVRQLSYRHIGDLPFILVIAIATDDIDAPWQAKALPISLLVLVLCAVTIGLSVAVCRELCRRTAAEAAMAEANARLEQLSLTDGLTGLANRRRFDDVIAREWRRAARMRKALCLLVIDVDHFKSCNDRYGHAVGDLILTSLGAAIAGSLHRAGDLACRIGGEEFAVILSDTDAAGAARVCEAIHVAVAGIRIAETGADAVTVSIGAACREGDAFAEGPEALFAAADAALYDAKRHGRNGTRWDADGAARVSLPRVA